MFCVDNKDILPKPLKALIRQIVLEPQTDKTDVGVNKWFIVHWCVTEKKIHENIVKQINRNDVMIYNLFEITNNASN